MAVRPDKQGCRMLVILILHPKVILNWQFFISGLCNVLYVPQIVRPSGPVKQRV